MKILEKVLSIHIEKVKIMSNNNINLFDEDSLPPLKSKKQIAYNRNRTKFNLLAILYHGGVGSLTVQELEKYNQAMNLLGQIRDGFDEVSREEFGMNVPKQRCNRCHKGGAVTKVSIEDTWTYTQEICHRCFVKLKNEIKKNPELHKEYKLEV